MDSFNPLGMSGTPDLTEEERQKLLAEEAMLDDAFSSEPIPDTQNVGESTGSPSSETQVKPEQKSVTEPEKEEKEQKDFYGADVSFQEDDVDPSIAQTVAEYGLAIPTGMTDIVVDGLNLLPGVDLPKIPKFESKVTQTVREISSVVLPTVGLTSTGVGAVGAAAKLSKVKIFADPFVKWLGNASLSAGIGAAVDFTVETSQEDANLAQFLKESWPQTYGWIPQDLATLDSDSPETKRWKNVAEGAYLGFGADVLLGAADLVKGLRKIDRATQWKPRDETSGKWLEKNLTIDATPEDAVNRSAAKREELLDEIGDANLEKPGAVEELEQGKAVYGVTDNFNYQEVAGVRTKDDLGIVGALKDNSQIKGNHDTVNGRLGSVFTTPAIRKGLEANKEMEAVIRGQSEILKDVKVDYETATGIKITHEKMVEDADGLADDLYQLNIDGMRQKLETSGVLQYDADVDAMVLKSKGYAEVFNAIKKYIKTYNDLDQYRAKALIDTSMAGQISDMAQAIRFSEGTPAIERIQEEILDRIEFLSIHKGITSYARGSGLARLNLWRQVRRLKDASMADKAEFARAKELLKSNETDTLRNIERIRKDSKELTNTLGALSKENPEMLDAFWLAWDISDGNVNTVSRLNNYVQNSTGVFKKVLFDKQPEIPSLVVQGMFSNLYNSVLSAFATPIKAGLSNAYLLLEKPVRTMAGAALSGDVQTMRRGYYQFSSTIETLQDSFRYFGTVFKKTGSDPFVVASRDDIRVNNENQLRVLKEFAEAKSKTGDNGPEFMLTVVENIQALADHPYLRFGNRAMQAADGFTQSFIATFEAKGRVYDQLTKAGRDPLTDKEAPKLVKQMRESMFDKETGILKDEVVEATAGEIAMNLDNAANDALSGLMRRMPILKTFLLFTKTPLNELKMAASYTPLGVFRKLSGDFDLPFEKAIANEEKVRAMFASRGIKDVDSLTDMRAKYNEIRADIKGREAIGTLAVLGTVGMFMNGSITGNGLLDFQKQKTRRDLDWKPRSIRLPGGDWVSYDNLGPLTSWITAVADTVDNFDEMTPNQVGSNLKKLALVLGSTITDKTSLKGMEALFDFLNGDAPAINKWASTTLNSAIVPGSSQWAELSRLLVPGLKEVERDTLSYMRNRNPFSKPSLPDKHDWIDGGKIGAVSAENFFAHIWNTYMPWKINGKISPEKQFLIDIEYDGRPALSERGGVRYTNEEISEITDIMGRDELFLQRLRVIMKSSAAKEFRKRFFEARANGNEVDASIFEDLHGMIDRELKLAQQIAESRSSFKDQRSQAIFRNQVEGQLMRRGRIKELEEFRESFEKEFSK